jgi:hypothetical protein
MQPINLGSGEDPILFAHAACLHLCFAGCMGDADRPACAVGLTPVENVIVLLTPN